MLRGVFALRMKDFNQRWDEIAGGAKAGHRAEIA